MNDVMCFENLTINMYVLGSILCGLFTFFDTKMGLISKEVTKIDDQSHPKSPFENFMTSGTNWTFEKFGGTWKRAI